MLIFQFSEEKIKYIKKTERTTILDSVTDMTTETTNKKDIDIWMCIDIRDVGRRKPKPLQTTEIFKKPKRPITKTETKTKMS